MRHKNFEVTKLVDTFIVTDKVKPYDNPLGGGKLEQWWNDDAEGKHGVKKIGTNRTESGGNKATELSPTVAETLIGFRFKGCEFGNWLSQAERYDVFTAFQRCLSDLSHWLKTKNIGFDNLFGVAFGARGSRGASAHYEPWSNMINMTKEQGSGKFLHEYAHAIDYSIGAFVPGEQNVNYTALSGGTTTNQEKDNVGCQFRAMMNKILLYVRSTESYKRMLKSNKCRARRGYWTNSTELFARLTEAYYAYFYNDKKNYYLVERPLYYLTGNKEDGIYLTKDEIQVIKPELDKFWNEVSLLLNDKCTLKKTPFPKFEKENKKPAVTSKEMYGITVKRREKSCFTVKSIWMGEDHMLRMTIYDSEKKTESQIAYNGYGLESKLTKSQYAEMMAFSNGYDKESQKKILSILSRLGWFKDSKMTPAEKKQAASDYIKETTGKKKKKEKPKTEETKSDLYSICHWDYTDKTFKKVKEKVGVMKAQKDKSLSQCITMLDHAERGSKKSNNPFIGWGMFVSRTKYSIRRILGDGTYRESFIIDSNGKRLTEPKAEPKADSDSSKKKS